MSDKHQKVNDALQFPLGDAFEKAVVELMEAHPDGELDLVIAVIDLDNFLRINETFGIDIGDQVLIETGRQLAADLPENAQIYRIAGDEFGILFTGLLDMTNAVNGLKDVLGSAFAGIGNNPFLGYLSGAGVAFVLQSSSATIGILQAFSMHLSLPFSTIYVVLVGIYLLKADDAVL